MSKVKVGKVYAVKVTPKGKYCSGGPGTREGEGKCKLKITKSNGNNSYNGIIDSMDNSLQSKGFYVGSQYNIFDYELVVGPYNKEAIEKEIAEVNKEKAKLESKVEELNSKIEWLGAVGVDEFDEDEYKVYRTLSILEDENVGKVEKMKEIAKMLK